MSKLVDAVGKISSSCDGRQVGETPNSAKRPKLARFLHDDRLNDICVCAAELSLKDGPLSNAAARRLRREKGL